MFTDFQKSDDVVEKARPSADQAFAEVVENPSPRDDHVFALVVEKKNPLSIEEIKFCESEVVATTPPCEFVDSSAEVTPERTKFVVVAVPDTVRPPVAVPLPIVVDA